MCLCVSVCACVCLCVCVCSSEVALLFIQGYLDLVYLIINIIHITLDNVIAEYYFPLVIVHIEL